MKERKMGCYQILMLISMLIELLMLGGILTLEILQYQRTNRQYLNIPCWDEPAGKWYYGPCNT